MFRKEKKNGRMEVVKYMVKKELLSPCGNMEALYQAVHHGADAVYLSGKSYGARKFAANFSEEELEQAVRYAHLFGVKVYVTVNTLMYEGELEDCLTYVKFLNKIGVDALIVQDFGLLKRIREMMPELEIHASTQMHNATKEGLQVLKDLGVKRAVLARELSLDEIKKMDVDIEKEVFIHGALCVSYSGCCLYSSMVGGRSGNRGECAGSCRLPYRLKQKDGTLRKEGYLLSCKELNTAPKLDEILESDIRSLKIEGRMKSPEYVGFITQFYRDLIDQYEKTKTICIQEETMYELKTLFNRHFTLGHLFSATDEERMNIESPNHIGAPLGTVIEVDRKWIKIKLEHPLTQEDGVRFLHANKGMIVNYLYDEKKRLIHSAEASSIVYLDNKVGLEKGDLVHKTIDHNLMEQLKQYSKKKIPITMKFETSGSLATLTVDDGIHQVTQSSNIVEKAKTAPSKEENIQEKLLKLGDTPFCCQKVSFDLEPDIFLPVSSLNELRRSTVKELEEIREAPKVRKEINSSRTALPWKITCHLSASVQTEEQLKKCLALGLNEIEVHDVNLWNKYKDNETVYYVLPRCHKSEVPANRVVVTELGGLLCSGRKKIDYTLNTTNHDTIYVYRTYGVEKVTLSVETSKDQDIAMINAYEKEFGNTPNVEKIVYGRMELMLLKYNVTKGEKGLFLEDRKGSHYPLTREGDLTHLWSSEKMNLLSDISVYKENNITNFKLLFLEETATEVEEVVKKCQLGVIYE